MIIVEPYVERVVSYRTNAKCNRCGAKVLGISYPPDGWETLWENAHLCRECQEACKNCDYNVLKPRCGVVCNIKPVPEK